METRRSSLPSERLSLKLNFLSLRERPSRPRLFLSKRTMMFEDLEWIEQAQERVLYLEDQHSKLRPSLSTRKMSEDLERIEQAYKLAIDPEKSNFQVKTFTFNKKKISESPRRKEKRITRALDSDNHTFKSKIETFKSKINPSRRKSNQSTLYLFICNKY